MIELQQIQKLDPRSVWSHEAHDFTPWLASNLARLGDALGIELELVEREADVGGYSLDILARDLGRNANVIIENQLAATDHDHLGKLITYASGFDASVIIWIATDIREEHRQALDWLNQRTDSSTDIFGVVIEVIKIGDSDPALQFKVVVFPNHWQKSRKRQSSGVTSERSEKYRRYFQSFIDDLRENHRFTSARKGQPQSWYSFTSGNKLFSYGHSFATKNRVRTEIYIDSGDKDENESFFDDQYANRERIETAFGSELLWEKMEEKRACRIADYRNGSMDSPLNELQEIHEWAIDSLLRLKRVFGKSSP